MEKLNPNALPFNPANSAAPSNPTSVTAASLPVLIQHHPPPFIHQACFFYPTPFISSTPNPSAFNIDCYIPTGAPCSPVAPTDKLLSINSPGIKTMDETGTTMVSASSCVAKGPRVHSDRQRVNRRTFEGSCSRRYWIPKPSSVQKMPMPAADMPPEELELNSSLDELNRGGHGGQGKTTVMLKNIPNKFSKQQLLELLDEHCKKENGILSEEGLDAESPFSEFDFLYLPMDFMSGSNLGYAFVNFTSNTAARRLHRELHHKPWNAYGSRKVCEVTHAKIQGSEALLKHFRSSIFTCSSADYLPVFFNPSRDGFRQTKEQLVGKQVYPPAT